MDTTLEQDIMESTEAKPEAGQQLYERTMCLVLNITRWGITKKARMDNVSVDADKKLLRMSKRIIASEEYSAVSTIGAAARAYLRETALPSATFKSSVFLVPIEMIPMVDEKLTDLQASFSTAVDAFIRDYDGDPIEVSEKFPNGRPSLPERISEALRTQYNALDYPASEQVRQAFSFSWNYVSFDVPGKLAHISKALFQKEAAKAQAKLSAAADDVRLVLREGMATLVQTMVEKLSPAADGKKRVLRESSVAKLTDFFAIFDLKNVTDDAELSALVGKARDAMKGIDAEQLRSDDKLRQTTLAAFQQLAAEVDPLVVNLRSRQISFSEDAA